MTKNGVFREGKQWNKSHIYRVLHNRTYLGEVNHKDKSYPGEHEQIVSRDLWERAHAVIQNSKKNRSQHTRAKAPALLKGLIRCGACDRVMSPVSATNKDRIYRYYQCGKASKNGHNSCPVRSVAAGEIEGAVIHQLKSIFQSPEILAQTFQARPLSPSLRSHETSSMQSSKHRERTSNGIPAVRPGRARVESDGHHDSALPELVAATFLITGIVGCAVWHTIVKDPKSPCPVIIAAHPRPVRRVPLRP